MSGRKKLSIRIYSDVMCPWCIVGRKRLEVALEQSKDEYEAEIKWEPFYLRPDLELRDQPISKAEALKQLYGDSPEFQQRIAHLMETAKELGFVMAPGEKVPYVPTQKAHRLINIAAQYNKQDETSIELFNAYLARGENVAKDEVLLNVAEKVGLDKDKIQSALNSTEIIEATDQAEKKGRRQYRITGVPFYVIKEEGSNKEVAVSGAQEPKQFLKAFQAVTK
eukprot:TRINITY_DN7005_c0_g1_i1.p1 TRINITY_DN7005_c0_g1~~TRINITY_DN7005_c0_g1_i1.p1  ORF type:complete len:223 (-),score=61.73 TRINITY_DN7005_c0_g1_i1:21-689(-)